jgi:hypothetical protein
MPFSFNYLYFNAPYFNGFYLSMAGTFNVHIFQLREGESLLHDTTLFVFPARAIALLCLGASAFI